MDATFYQTELTAVDRFKVKVSDIEKDQDFINLIKDTMQSIKAQESEQWWQDKRDRLDNTKQSVLDKLQAAKEWTAEQWNSVSTSVSTWFDEKKQQMSQAWEEFKQTAGQEFENFKEAMQQFGERIAEMWGKAMESLGKLWDDIKIGTHDMYVDAKTTMQNLCTDMSYGAANLGISVQKGVLAMDDAFQTVKGTVSQAVADQFNKSAGKLLVESELAYNNTLNKQDEFQKMKFDGQDSKTIVSAQEYQDTVLLKMNQEHEKLTEKLQSRENLRDAFQGMKDNADFKKDVFNINRKNALNTGAHLNTRGKNAAKQERSESASQEKSSYADKVKNDRATPNREGGRGG